MTLYLLVITVAVPCPTITTKCIISPPEKLYCCEHDAADSSCCMPFIGIQEMKSASSDTSTVMTGPLAQTHRQMKMAAVLVQFLVQSGDRWRA